MIDNKKDEKLKPNFKKDLKTIKEGIVFTFGKGDKEIYLVTDPECPYCQKLEKEKGKILEDKYRVHVILFPLPFHKNAVKMSMYILAAKSDKERRERLKEIINGDKKWQKFNPKNKEEFEKILNELKKSVNAARELGAQGTPSLYDKNLKQLNWTTLGE